MKMKNLKDDSSFDEMDDFVRPDLSRIISNDSESNSVDISVSSMSGYWLDLDKECEPLDFLFAKQGDGVVERLLARGNIQLLKGQEKTGKSACGLMFMAVAAAMACFVNRAWKTFRRPEKVRRGMWISVEKGWGAAVYNPVFRCITAGPLLRPSGVAFPPRFSRGCPRVFHVFFHMSLRIVGGGSWPFGREEVPLPHEKRKGYEKTDCGRALPHGRTAV